MLSKRPLTASLVFIIALAAALCVWLVFVAPIFQEKERLVRSENAALKKDVTEIEAMDGSVEELDGMIAATDGSIRQKYDSRAVTADGAAKVIEEICSGLGHSPLKISLGQRTLLFPAGAYAPALYSVDVTFLIESDEEAGAAIIRGLENRVSADFEVKAFVYRAQLPEPIGEEEEGEGEDEAAYMPAPLSGEWIFTVTLYYYE